MSKGWLAGLLALVMLLVGALLGHRRPKQDIPVTATMPPPAPTKEHDAVVAEDQQAHSALQGSSGATAAQQATQALAALDNLL